MPKKGPPPVVPPDNETGAESLTEDEGVAEGTTVAVDSPRTAIGKMIAILKKAKASKATMQDLREALLKVVEIIKTEQESWRTAREADQQRMRDQLSSINKRYVDSQNMLLDRVQLLEEEVKTLRERNTGRVTEKTTGKQKEIPVHGQSEQGVPATTKANPAKTGWTKVGPGGKAVKQATSNPKTTEPSRVPGKREPVKKKRPTNPAVLISAEEKEMVAKALTDARSSEEFTTKIQPYVTAVRKARFSNAVIVELKDEADLAETVAAALRRVVSEETTIRSLTPMEELVCKGIDVTASKAEFVAKARQFLDLHVEERDVKMAAAHDGSMRAWFKVPMALTGDLLKRTITVGWTVCHLERSTQKLRCARCGALGHRAAACTGEDRTKLCFRCGRERHEGPCRSGRVANLRTQGAANEKLCK